MRLVIFTSKDHVYANKIIKKLILKKSVEVVRIVESKSIYPKMQIFNALIKYLTTSGTSYTILQICKAVFYKILFIIYPIIFTNRSSVFYPYSRMVEKKRIIRVFDIQDKDFEKRILGLKVDLFISISFNQIFTSKILKIPAKGTINVHPSLLPSYRGVSPTFWVLANNEKKNGISIHRILNREIDKGDLLAQAEVNISKKDTEHSLYWKCVNVGIPLLLEVIEKINDNSIKSIKYKRGVSPSYFSLPTKHAVKKFYKNKRHFFKLKELFYEG